MNEKRKRSPNYPFISMKTAETYLRSLYDARGTFSIPFPLAMNIMDLNPNSSSSTRIISAMLDYKVIEDQGIYPEKKIKISSLGEKIIRLNTTIMSLKFRREAVLNSEIMQEIFTYFGPNLPVKNELESILRQKWDFIVSAAENFSVIIEENYSYAKLNFETSIAKELKYAEENPNPQESSITDNTVYKKNKQPLYLDKLLQEDFIDYRIPLEGGHDFAYLIVPYTISQNDIEYIQNHITLILSQLKKNKS